MMQRTLSSSLSLSGVGLHSGEQVELTLLPASDDHGIVFERVDLDPPVKVPLDPFRVFDTLMSTNIDFDGVRIATAEHLMSALAGLGIDNLLVQVNSSEMPIMDGSAQVFVDAILATGIREQRQTKKFIKVLKPVSVTHEDKQASLAPHDGFTVDFRIDFDHPVFADQQQRVYELSTENYINQIGYARTFGFEKDLEYLKQNNLARGGSLQNAVVLSADGLLNPEGLRQPDELLSHKVLDAVGDLYLSGHQILGHFRAVKSGHMLNNRLLQALLSEPESFEWVSFTKDCPIEYIEAKAAQ